MWQDYVLTTASFLFGYSIFPQLVKNFKAQSAEHISWQLMFVTLIALFISAAAVFTLGLYLTGVMNCIQMICWTTMVFQKIYYRTK